MLTLVNNATLVEMAVFYGYELVSPTVMWPEQSAQHNASAYHMSCTASSQPNCDSPPSTLEASHAQLVAADSARHLHNFCQLQTL
jgi:hypothetical protein